jgi:Fic family protein
MNLTFQAIERLWAELRDLQPLKEEVRRNLDKKIRLEFNYNSNHIEGNTLTYSETRLPLLFDWTTGNHDLREYEEMKVHDVAFGLISELANDPDRPLTESNIKNLQKILLVRPFWKEANTEDRQ